jgi:hypothetical protein
MSCRARASGDARKEAQSASAWFVGDDFTTNADFVNAYRGRFNGDPDQFAELGSACRSSAPAAG